MKRDVQDSDEEAVRVKEQSILELGGLLAKTGQAAGKNFRQLLTVTTDWTGLSYSQLLMVTTSRKGLNYGPLTFNLPLITDHCYKLNRPQ